MATMFVRHTVSNYQTWRKVYDDLASVQKAKGVTAQAVYQAADNPNDITVTHEFATVEAAQTFAKSDQIEKGYAECWRGSRSNNLVHQQKIRPPRGNEVMVPESEDGAPLPPGLRDGVAAFGSLSAAPAFGWRGRT